MTPGLPLALSAATTTRRDPSLLLGPALPSSLVGIGLHRIQVRLLVFKHLCPSRSWRRTLWRSLGVSGSVLLLTSLGFRPRDALLPPRWWWGLECLVLDSGKRTPLGASVDMTLTLVATLWGRSGQHGGEECRGSLAGACVRWELSPTHFLGSQSLIVAAG